MPISNSKNILEFVNGLERQISEINDGISDWNSNKNKLISNSNRIDGININAVQSLVKADEALGELSTATFASNAKRGKRLEDTLAKLKEGIFTSIQNGDVIGVGSGGGELTGGMFYEELNNAIAEVDSTVQDGIKLDYRLRGIQEMSVAGKQVSEKEMLLPRKMFLETATSYMIDAEIDDDQSFVDGEVTVLNENLLPIYANNEIMIEGVINKEGVIQLTELPNEKFYIYYPVQMNFIDIPKDFVYLFFDLLIDKHSPLMSAIIKIQDLVDVVTNDIQSMKGKDWTADFSIMSNHLDLVKESITPKGVHVNVLNNKAVLSFSYADSEILSHFVAEELDPKTNEWKPVNDNGGIINK